MEKFDNAIKIMNEQFAKDVLISIATIDGNRPSVRVVSGYYEDGAFYVITHMLTSKMSQIKANPNMAVCDSTWFSGHGIGENLGWVCDEKNAAIMAKLREVYVSWYYTSGHVNENDKNTCLLRIRLTDGVIIDEEKKYGEWMYKVDFVNRTA